MAASVKSRLMNVARERKEDFNFLLTRYVLERLLYRLAQSPHAGTLLPLHGSFRSSGHQGDRGLCSGECEVGATVQTQHIRAGRVVQSQVAMLSQQDDALVQKVAAKEKTCISPLSIANAPPADRMVAPEPEVKSFELVVLFSDSVPLTEIANL